MRIRARIFGELIVAAILCAVWSGLVTASVPPDAARYQRDLVREARSIWGLAAPIAGFAGQIHQESRWNPNARSAFAAGLTQFTPDTAKWISGAYPRELGDNQPLNPQWAIRALLIYDLQLWNSLHAATACDRMAKVLSGYNGGPGWVTRETRATVAAGGDGERWWGQVENHCLARKRPAARTAITRARS